MKRIPILVFCALMTAFLGLVATGADARADAPRKISVVATIFPEYDWVRTITKGTDNVAVTTLIKSGIDLHSYQPSVEDMVKISSCDVFIHVGGESDAWVEKTLANATNKQMKVINLLEILGKSAKEEMLVEGMQAEEEEKHGDAKDEAAKDEGPEYDEHVWLSIRNAAVFVAAIRDVLAGIDPAHANIYESNVAEYLGKLHDLDVKYGKAIGASKRKVLLFGDRFPFRYLTDDYGLSYYAAFAGCSAESEASFKTVQFLAGKVDALGLPVVLTLEGSDQRIAKTVIAATKDKNAQILAMDSMQTFKSGESLSGPSYLSIMEKNLEVLKAALR